MMRPLTVMFVTLAGLEVLVPLKVTELDVGKVRGSILLPPTLISLMFRFPADTVTVAVLGDGARTQL
jgi:hypothetical protein